MDAPVTPVATYADAFFGIIRNPLKFRLFLLQKLPAAYFSDLRIRHINENSCRVSVPFKWFTQNPFRCTYFACLSMAAELTTGTLVMANIYKRKPAASMLLVSMESTFYKKAVGRTTFICKEGIAIKEAVQKAYDILSPQSIKVASQGYNEAGELVAAFSFTWSFKVK